MKCACWSAPYDGQNPAVQDPSSKERERSSSNVSMPVANGNIPNQVSLSPQDAQAPAKRSLSATEFEQKQIKPDLGPFLITLFQKVERMPQNTFYVNLILTGVVTRLALYPQPLLRSFLLNYNMVLKPGVRSLFQVGDVASFILMRCFLLCSRRSLSCPEKSSSVFIQLPCPANYMSMILDTIASFWIEIMLPYFSLDTICPSKPIVFFELRPYVCGKISECVFTPVEACFPFLTLLRF